MPRSFMESRFHSFRLSIAALPVAAIVLTSCGTEAERAPEHATRAAVNCLGKLPAPVAIEGGQFAMGQEDVYREEGPKTAVSVDSFWMDATEVTNAQFARFVEDTGYRTVAEKPVDPALFDVPPERIPEEMLQPGSAVFRAPARPSSHYSDWWEYRPGASWRMPEGPGAKQADPDRPVVHLAYADMEAYARWRGGRLPTEAEWEFAARAGAPDYTDQPSEANSWQGAFPVKDFAEDGFAGLAPVACYAPNAWGLHDMIGNVWEVTSDLYAPGHDPDRPSANPRGPTQAAAFDPDNPGLPSRVMKGGSYLCAPNYCQRYRPAARQGRDPGLGASNVGFRLVYDSRDKALDRFQP